MNPPPRGQYYTPALRRSESSSSRLRPARDGDEGQLTATTTTGIRPRRQKSLVRPERERIDASHRQYYYRQHATNQGDVVPSTTGNQPLATTEDAPALLERTPTTGSRIERRPTVRQMFLRRGKSILGREEKLSDNEDHRLHIAGEFSDGAGAVQFRKSLRERLPDPWLTYCRILTCCIPDHLLTVFGMIEMIDRIIVIVYRPYFRYPSRSRADGMERKDRPRVFYSRCYGLCWLPDVWIYTGYLSYTAT